MSDAPQEAGNDEKAPRREAGRPSGPSPAGDGPRRVPEWMANPILVRGLRGRMRPKHILSWGTITLTLTAFVTIMVFLTTSQQRLTTTAEAAKLTVLPIIIIQGVILMLLGTGSVASGLSLEREKGLLDYLRMTPMSPTAKILGYLFGLPIREYFLFALTLPFLGFAIVVGEISPLKMLNFYVVFFSSVWLYHMTGMVAGMATSKPRQASMVAQGMVVLLYIILPQLTWFGLTFFEFLTVRPTFYAMVSEELAAVNRGVQMAAAQQFRGLNQAGEVPFFNLDVHTTIFTLMVQVFLLVLLVVVIWRKWRDEFSHPLSKLHALAAYAGATVFLAGSLWPIVDREMLTSRLTRQFGGFHGGEMPPVYLLFIMCIIFLLVCGLAALAMVVLTTPNRWTQLRALRLARKHGAARVPPNADGASSTPLALAIAGITAMGFALVMWRVAQSDRFVAELPPLLHMVLPVAYFAAAGLLTQAIQERFSSRIFIVAVFMLWGLPFFVTAVLYAAFEAWVTGAYIGVLSPPLGIWLTLANMFHAAEPGPASAAAELPYTPPGLESHLGAVAVGGTLLYGTMALVAHAGLRRWQSEMRQRELLAPPPQKDQLAPSNADEPGPA